MPKVAEIQEAARGMTADARAFVLARARALGVHSKVVEEALGEEGDF